MESAAYRDSKILFEYIGMLEISVFSLADKYYNRLLVVIMHIDAQPWIWFFKS